jgi:hypothetical protein
MTEPGFRPNLKHCPTLLRSQVAQSSPLLTREVCQSLNISWEAGEYSQPGRKVDTCPSLSTWAPSNAILSCVLGSLQQTRCTSETLYPCGSLGSFLLETSYKVGDSRRIWTWKPQTHLGEGSLLGIRGPLLHCPLGLRILLFPIRQSRAVFKHQRPLQD